MFKKVILSALALGIGFSYAQNKKNATPKAPEGWHLGDLAVDGYPGVSVKQAYEQLAGRSSQTVIVAVIDDGVDYRHEDLASVMWTNTKEIDGNGKDDDGNGYIDDIHGWNFIGGATEDIDHDTQEMVRVYNSMKGKYGNMTADKVSPADKAEFERFQKIKKDIEKERAEMQEQKDMIEGMKKIISQAGAGDMNVPFGKVKTYMKTFKPVTKAEKKAKFYLKLIGAKIPDDKPFPVERAFGGAMEQINGVLDYHLNENYDPRSKVVGDNYALSSERIYGNNHVISHNGDHGTHVSGIIAGDRKNGIGTQGIADNVRIMAIRVVPDGDERDKDVANGIRYAVDNGAKVINMSFGKSYEWDKQAVDDAVRYAASKDVLLVHAAGNDGKNNDNTDNFPNPVYKSDNNRAANWLEIGASSWHNDALLPARFSNYGKRKVDVFSPGVAIYSTTKGNQYASYDGTSMASPVAAGIAALLRSYFPTLTAPEVRDILMQSAIPITYKVQTPGGKKKVMMTELSVTGAVVNAAKAVEMAKQKTGK